MRHQLSAIDHHDGTDALGGGNELIHRPKGAGDIRHARHGDDLHRIVEYAVQLAEIHFVILGEIQIDELDACVAGYQLPGDDVGVVLHDGEKHLVSRLQDVEPVPVGDSVQGRGRSAGEYDLVWRTGIDERRHPGPGSLVGIGGLDGKCMGTAVHVRVHRPVVVVDGIKHLHRFLSGGCRVEIHEGVPVHLTAENGEIVPKVGQVGHVAAASERYWSYPVASMASASSAPPVSMIRPSSIT